MLVLIRQLLAFGMKVVELNRQRGRAQKLEGNKFENAKALASGFRLFY